MKQQLKNIIYIVLGAVIGFMPAYLTMKGQQDVMIEAIQKNTSEIQNTFTNEFKKIKNKKGERINVNIDPNVESYINIDSVDVKRRRRRLFDRFRR